MLCKSMCQRSSTKAVTARLTGSNDIHVAPITFTTMLRAVILHRQSLCDQQRCRSVSALMQSDQGLYGGVIPLPLNTEYSLIYTLNTEYSLILVLHTEYYLILNTLNTEYYLDLVLNTEYILILKLISQG